MASNNGNFPLDLQDVEPYNPSLPNYQLGLIEGTSIAGIEQHWANDTYVGSNHQGNNMVMHDEVVYPRTASNSPGRCQYSDLQNADLGEQFGSSSLQVDAAPNYGDSNGPNMGQSLFPTDRHIPFQPSGSYQLYTNEPHNNLTTEYESSTHEHPDYLLHDFSDPGINIVPNEYGLSYPDFDAQPSHKVARETSSNNQLPECGLICSGVDMSPSFEFESESVNHGVLREVEPSCSSLSMPSGNAFLGDPRNSGALGGSETSFTLLGAWQPHHDQSNKNAGPSSGAVPRRTQQSRSAVLPAEGSCSFPQDCGGETSDSSSYSTCQDHLVSNNPSQRHVRYRTPKSKYDKMTPEEKLSQKRQQGAKASKKYWSGKRKSETQTLINFNVESTRNLELQENFTRNQRRVQLLSIMLRNLNIDSNSRHPADKEDEDTSKEQ